MKLCDVPSAGVHNNIMKHRCRHHICCLPNLTQHNIRKRRHNITLPEKKGHLAAKNFIINFFSFFNVCDVLMWCFQCLSVTLLHSVSCAFYNKDWIGDWISQRWPISTATWQNGDGQWPYSLIFKCNQCNQRKQNSAYYSGRETRSSNFIRSPSDSTLMKPRPVKQHNFC